MAQEPVKDVFEEDEQREARESENTNTDDFEVEFSDENPAEETEEQPAEEEAAAEEEPAAEEPTEEAASEEEDPDEDTESDLDDDEDLTKYSRSVRKRVDRERRLRRQADEVAEQERAARVAAQRENVTNQKQFVDFMLSSLDAQIGSVRQQLATARDAGGDTTKEVELIEKLSDLTSKKRQAEEAKTKLENTKIDDQPTITPEARRWMVNNRWFNHPRFQAETNFSRQIDAKLSGEGLYRPGSAEYMRELDRRVNEAMPDLRRRIGQTFKAKPVAKEKEKEHAKEHPKTQQQPRRSAAAPVTRAAAPSAKMASSKNRVVLSPADQELMRSFKLDPTNKEHVRAFAEERRANGGR